MTDPFRIEGPAVISFSGGRTSGLMLRRILDAHGGSLPPDALAVFANTGKERPETLDFVRDCGERWGVNIVWVEYGGRGNVFRVVDHASASRAGEPFDALINERKFLPFPSARFCTAELKVRVLRDFMVSRGHDHWSNVVGLRYDEPRRVANILANGRERWVSVCPLYDARITVEDVTDFWRVQPFDLALKSYEGNCDLCFLKGVGKRRRIIEERPELAAWWVDAEARVGARFRAHGPSYSALADSVSRQGRLSLSILDDPTDTGDCACTD